MTRKFRTVGFKFFVLFRVFRGSYFQTDQCCVLHMTAHREWHCWLANSDREKTRALPNTGPSSMPARRIEMICLWTCGVDSGSVLCVK